MFNIRNLSLEQRLSIYKNERVKNQADWYSKKSLFNKRRAKHWFIVSVVLHAIAIALLLWRITEPSLSLPIEVVATGESAVLTWLQAKKHNELNSSYSLAAHEIVLIKSEAESVASDKELSNFVVSSESAFSREHTQWSARKNG
ncbi:SLATT domain-containing protein [Agarivorans sp. QJM3NY_29]|uniref:SLATT domain-containing protein n=1 Tax=unclassified Agarivorans TaxID=2636026 RepID=UPI003D7C73F8